MISLIVLTLLLSSIPIVPCLDLWIVFSPSKQWREGHHLGTRWEQVPIKIEAADLKNCHQPSEAESRRGSPPQEGAC